MIETESEKQVFLRRRRWPLLFFASVPLIAISLLNTTRTHAGNIRSFPDEPLFRAETEAASNCQDIVTAQVVALDQVYTYNRFGSYNPAGMMYALQRDVVPINITKPLGPGNVRLRDGKRPRPLVLRVNKGDCLRVEFTNLLSPASARASDSPATREASVHVNGLQLLNIVSDGGAVGYNPSGLVAPGDSTTYLWEADREGTFFMHSMGALFGGQAHGGSTVQGLFGVVTVEPEGSRWYRSQVTPELLEAAQLRDPQTGLPLENPDGTPILDYDAVDELGEPLLNMRNDANELIAGDLNAIITGYELTEYGAPSARVAGYFREFTIMFHDELKTVQAFPELEQDPTLKGGRDGFGINYGSDGLGAKLLANRKKIGPTKDCPECKFEEFFLASWAGGDPALNVDEDEQGGQEALYPDDPSNVQHSYLGDPVRIRNIHAGPGEHHVFHLHGHQWLYQPSSDGSSLLDSQTIGPGSAFTYDINYGGSGNRNLSPGDAIFHCHLYPHFAQGMWGLWRVHDVFEAGTADRALPDGELIDGVPNPAVVPIPGVAMLPMPTYTPTWVKNELGVSVKRPAFPGYPFYIAGVPGHRPPQPPLDLAFDGGLPRHVMTSAPEDAVLYGQRGRFDVQIEAANLKLLPEDGTPSEQAAMSFHAGKFPGGKERTNAYGWKGVAYPGYLPDGTPGEVLVNGREPQPGAPFADPCPSSANLRRYRAAYVQTNGVVNNEGWHDPQLRTIVLEEDVDATLSGQRPLEPFFFRANSGDCIEFSASNLIPEALQEDDFQLFTQTDTIGQHIHLVKFDLTSSDGSANGWNYEDGTFSYEEVLARIDAANALGGALQADGSLEEQGDRIPLEAKVHPRMASAPLGTQTTVQRWWADPLVNRANNDRTIRTVFTHDHFAPSSHQQHGFYGALVVEPRGSRWRDPENGTFYGSRADGGPTSWKADILTERTQESFREFNLALADFALLYDACGEPVNPPTRQEAALPIAVEHIPGLVRPEAISVSEPGTMTVNYRNEPIPLRVGERSRCGETYRQREGKAGDMAYVFSSTVHGDPATPLLKGYEGDRVQIRLIQGAQEEQHAFSLLGHKWLREDGDPDSGYVASQSTGISEHFEAVLSNGLPQVKNPNGTADYLYMGAATDDLWNGMWGFMRAYEEEQPDLLPLPSNADARAFKGKEKAPACPPSATKRVYDVQAVLARDVLPEGVLMYNQQYDLYDPDAILFVKEEHLSALKAGTRPPEPLVLRAAAGECVVVNLQNRLPELPPNTPHWTVMPPITEHFNLNQVQPSGHVSLTPQLVQYEVNASEGTNVGYNLEQTVAPGQQRTYRWYAGDFTMSQDKKGKVKYTTRPLELGAINLRDMGDVMHHPMHGGIGALIIEPQGAVWVEDEHSDAQARVFYGPDQTSYFREHVLVAQDSIPLFTRRSEFIQDATHVDRSTGEGTALRGTGEPDDPEASGHPGFNYRTEPLWARLELPPNASEATFNEAYQADLLSSYAFGDPATPVMIAKAGDPLRIRVLMPSSHGTHFAFTQHGMTWANNPILPGSRSAVMGINPNAQQIATQGALTSSGAFNIISPYGAGGRYAVPGDYLYREQTGAVFGGGMWGILRVIP